MKLITHMEPSQLRLGYLTCLSLVAGRQLDTRQGLVDRLCRFLFNMVDASDCRWAKLMEHVDKDELNRITPPEDDRMTALQEMFRMKSPNVPSYPLQALWLAQQRLPSHLGLLAVKNAEHILEMGRSFEILTTGFALSEKGVFLQNYALQVLTGVLEGAPKPIPSKCEFVRPCICSSCTPC